MSLRCLIIEDEPMAQKILHGYIKDTPFLNLIEICDDAVDGMEAIKRLKDIDLIFLDIEMPKLRGFEFLKLLSNPPKIIVTTAYTDFAIEAFELNVVDYLLKPFSYNRFLKAVNKSFMDEPKRGALDTSSFVFLKKNRKMVKLDLNHISIVEGLSNYIKIHYQNNVVVIYEGLTSFQERVKSNTFIRIHKSYLVNFAKVSAWTKEFVEIDDKHIPIGKSYREAINDFFKSF